MMNVKEEPTTLNGWLKTVSTELSIRRIEARATPRPKRNREREKARREARQLFASYYAERAVSYAS
jgi:hypothetical protein